jgi:hypothetical protein
MTPVSPAINIPFVTQRLPGDGSLDANEVMEDGARAMLDELGRVEAATRRLR